MRAPNPAALLLAALLASGCAGTPAPDAPPPLTATADAVRDLDLSFRDPSGGAAYRIVGPYRVVATTANGIELSGIDPDFQREARLLLFVQGETLWALAEIDGREFLTRVN